MATPQLGWIEPKDRTKAQDDAHQRAMASLPRFSMPGYSDPPKGTKIMLTDFWKEPDCVADMGTEFSGFGQHTGSCVGVSAGNAGTTLACVQRCIADNPTKAYIVFWPFAYGRTRYNEGDRGQGDGAVDSVMGETLVKEGFFDITQPGLPQHSTGADGFWLASSSVEFQWSDGARIDQKWKDLARPNAGMTKAIIEDVQGIRAALVNGYPILDGCSNYVGNGSIKGSGNDAYVTGHYDGRGGHSTCFLGVWNHPTDGWLYLYSNQWQTSTYPKDPAGAGRCCVWLKESEVEKLFRSGGSDGETMALSHAPGMPAQPKLLEWMDL